MNATTKNVPIAVIVNGDRWTNVTGKDLRCPICGEGAADVAPDYTLDNPFFRSCTILWTCKTGHKQFFTWERTP